MLFLHHIETQKLQKLPLSIDQIKDKKNQKHNGKKKEGDLFFKLNDLMRKDIQLFPKKLGDKHKENFYSSLETLFSSGIDIRTSLDIVYEENNNTKFKDIFLGLRENVINGDSLSDAMIKTKQFSAYEYQSIIIGEESGRLPAVLHELSKYYTQKIKQRRQITSALTYPVLVLITALAAITFMLNVIVPMFMDVFKRFGGELPALTKSIVKISEFISGNMFIIFIVFLAIVVLYFVVRKKEWYRKFSSYLLLKTPFAGKIALKIYLARFSQAMALLLGSKTPMLRALQLAREMIGFYPIEKALVNIEDMVMHGKSFHMGLGKYSLFEKRMVSLTKVAEEVNKLDTMFETLHNQYSNEVEHQTSILTGILEPVLIIFVGVIVAVILISMYMPLFQISTSLF